MLTIETDRVQKLLTVLTQWEGWVCMFETGRLVLGWIVDTVTSKSVSSWRRFRYCDLIAAIAENVFFSHRYVVPEISITSVASCESSKYSFFYTNPKFRKRQSFQTWFWEMYHGKVPSEIPWLLYKGDLFSHRLWLQMDFASIHVAIGLVLESDS
jgi:hypothetical protein